jgi:hypothetical protein
VGVGPAVATARSKQKFFASFFQKRSACLSCDLVGFTVYYSSHPEPTTSGMQAKHAVFPK